MEPGEYTGQLDDRLQTMFFSRSGATSGRALVRRRLAWPLLIIAIAIPIAFISGRLEQERSSAAISFGEAVALWDGNSTVPEWLSEAAEHPLLLMDLSQRLARRPRTDEVQISASLEDDGLGGSRWRVRLSWPEAPAVDLLVSFRDLDTKPYLVGVGGGPAPTTEVVTP